MNSATFSTVLPRLVCAFEQGKLTPFIGAGMSTPACRLWPAFVERLETAAGLRSEEAGTNRTELVKRANRAMGRLRALGAPQLAAKVREALYSGPTLPPPQTAALARLFWPMVLSTNYDDCYVEAFRVAHGVQVDIRGRGPDDARAVLSALNEPAGPVLWALQGYLGGPAGAPVNRLSQQIVVGHDEYRKVAHVEPHFRRAFAEVFRNRSMLFLGSGLSEPYFLEMFSEILEIFGHCVRPHYAFARQGSLDIQFLATRFQTIVVEYASHDELAGWLHALADGVHRDAFRADRFSYSLRASRTDDPNAPCRRLTVVRGRLPIPSGSDECLAVSAGGHPGGRYFFSDSIRSLLAGSGVRGQPLPAGPEYVARFEGHPVYAVRAREPGDLRSLRVVRRATAELLDVASEAGYRRVLLQVLASGGTQEAGAEYDYCPFNALFSFVESVRAFGQWCRQRPDRQLELALHVVNPAIYSEVCWGRLDLQELLSSEDIRFWVQVTFPGGQIHTEMCQELEDVTAAGLADWIGLDIDPWEVSSDPPIGPAGETGFRPLSELKDEPLSSLVIPGGTLFFQLR